MMRSLLVPIVLVALAFPASATDCSPTTSAPEVTLGAEPTRVFYLDVDCPGRDTCLVLFSAWWYEETNGIPGLQRQDDIVDDTCGGQIPGDTIFF